MFSGCTIIVEVVDVVVVVVAAELLKLLLLGLHTRFLTPED